MDLEGFTERVKKKMPSVVEKLGRYSACASQEDVDGIIFALAPGVSMHELARGGAEGEQCERVEAFFDICGTMLHKLSSAPVALRESDATVRCIRILRACEDAAARYITGETWATVRRDVGLLPATLDTRDVRSRFHAVGVDAAKARVFDMGRTEQVLFDDYVTRGLFGPHTEQLVIASVPADVTEYFLHCFSPQERLQYANTVNSKVIGESLCAAPYYFEYVQFVARIIRTDKCILDIDSPLLPKEYRYLYPDYGNKEDPPAVLYVLFKEWQKDPQTIDGLLDLIPTDLVDEGLPLDMVLALLRSPNFSLANVQRDCKRYEKTLGLEHIVELYIAGVSCERAAQLIGMLPSGMRNKAFVMELLTVRRDTDMKLVAEFADLYMRDAEHQDGFSRSLFWWYADARAHVLSLMNACRKRGVRSLWAIYEIDNDERLSIKEWLAWANAIGKTQEESVLLTKGRATICAWVHAGLTPSDVAVSRELWDEDKGVLWHVVDAKNVRAYLALRNDAKKMSDMRYVCATYNIVPAEIVEYVRDGYTREMFDLVEAYDLGVLGGTLALARYYPDVVRGYPTYTHEQKIALFELRANDIVRMAEEGKTAADVLGLVTGVHAHEPVRVGEGTPDIVAPKDIRDAYADKLEGVSRVHARYVDLFKLCNVTPEYMYTNLVKAGHEKRLSNTIVNHIILCAYVEGMLPRRLSPLIEKYNISFFTRYPAAILDAMCREVRPGEDADTLVLLEAKTDWNGAADSSYRMLERIARYKHVVVYEVGSNVDVYRAIREVGVELEARDSKIPIVVLAGHGSSEGMQLGYPYASQRDLNSPWMEYLRALRRFLTDDAQVVLASCSTGKGGVGADNFATSVANVWKGVEVFAANTDVSTKDVVFDAVGRVTHVEFTDKDGTVVFKE